MKTLIITCVLLFLCIYCVICEDSSYLYGTRKLRHKRSVRQRAFNRACSTHTCENLKCNNEDGWYLYGSDWGCCGNYDGCCTWASSVCYFHDALCKCCDYGWFVCGPDCKKDAECFEKYEENTNKVFDNEKRMNDIEDSDNAVVSNIPESANRSLNKVTQKQHSNDVLQPTIFRKSRKHVKKKYLKKKLLQYKSKIIKTLNDIPGDELIMADQPQVDNVETGSGDNI